MANLWSGRFEKGMDEIVEEFNASIFFDKRLYDCDIAGSIAHVTMLCEQGIVNEEEKTASVTVPEYQLSLAIGKSGQNVRLAARLTGWKIDIISTADENSYIIGEE